MPDDTVRDGEGGGKWTVGPYHRDKRTVYALQPSGDWRVPMINRWSAHVQAAPGTPDAELEAVATLFQAAPDLAEALADTMRKLARCAEAHDNSPEVVRDMLAPGRAALAKARGEQG